MCLLIDDDVSDTADFATAMAEIDSPYKVLTLASARDAIMKLRNGEIAPEVIFLDLNMPCVNGYEFLVYLKGQMRHRSIPVIVYSMASDPAEVNRTRKLGAHAFFEKPQSYDILKARLMSIFHELEPGNATVKTSSLGGSTPPRNQ